MGEELIKLGLVKVNETTMEWNDKDAGIGIAIAFVGKGMYNISSKDDVNGWQFHKEVPKANVLGIVQNYFKEKNNAA